MADTKLYTEIMSKCKQAGLSIYEVCDHAGVDSSTVRRWKKKTPSTIRIINAIDKSIEKLSKKN